MATWRNSNGKEGTGRDCKGENYEVTSGGACTSFRFRSRSTLSLLLQPPPRPLHPPSSASGSGGWIAWSLAFPSTPFFAGGTPFPPSLFPSHSFLLVREPRPLSGAGPRCSETSHNGVTWLLLSHAHTPRSYSIAYTSLESHPTEVNPLPLPPFSVLHYAYSPPDKWRMRRTVRRTGLVHL